MDKLIVNVMDGKFTDSVASPSDSLEGVHVHAINTWPSFLPRGAGSEAGPHQDEMWIFDYHWFVTV